MNGLADPGYKPETSKNPANPLTSSTLISLKRSFVGSKVKTLLDFLPKCRKIPDSFARSQKVSLFFAFSLNFPLFFLIIYIIYCSCCEFFCSWTIIQLFFLFFSDYCLIWLYVLGQNQIFSCFIRVLIPSSPFGSQSLSVCSSNLLLWSKC